MNITIKVTGPSGDKTRTRFKAIVTNDQDPRYIAHLASPVLRTDEPQEMHHALHRLGVFIGFALAGIQNGKEWHDQHVDEFKRLTGVE
jgi:hypothetical protein